MDVSNDNSSSTKEIIHVIPTKKELKKLKEKKERSKSPDMPKESLKDERAKMRVERSGHQNSRVKLLWKSDLNKEVIIQNFIDRFWEETEDDDSWNFFWASVTTIKQIFSGKSYVKLNSSLHISFISSSFLPLFISDSICLKKYSDSICTFSAAVQFSKPILIIKIY